MIINDNDMESIIMARTDKERYYLDIADTVSQRSTCLRRKYGAIIVRNDEIISTGYNGAPRGRKNCDDLNFCLRERLAIPSGQGMSCAEVSTQKQMQLYLRPEETALEQRCISAVAMPKLTNSSQILHRVPCAADR